jgi:hypothetical protein
LKTLLKYTIPAFILFTVFSCSSDEDRLFKAIKRGDADDVRSLIEGGVSVLSTNKNGLTPIEIARLNNQPEITAIIYEQIKIDLEKDLNKLLKARFDQSIRDLKVLDRQRKQAYDSYLSSNDKMMNLISDDKRITDELITEEEKHYKAHQELIKTFINAKVDLIEEIQREFVSHNYNSNISHDDIKHIINVNIMYKLNSIN